MKTSLIKLAIETNNYYFYSAVELGRQFEAKINMETPSIVKSLPTKNGAQVVDIITECYVKLNDDQVVDHTHLISFADLPNGFVCKHLDFMLSDEHTTHGCRKNLIIQDYPSIKSKIPMMRIDCAMELLAKDGFLLRIVDGKLTIEKEPMIGLLGTLISELENRTGLFNIKGLYFTYKFDKDNETMDLTMVKSVSGTEFSIVKESVKTDPNVYSIRPERALDALKKLGWVKESAKTTDITIIKNLGRQDVESHVITDDVNYLISGVTNYYSERSVPLVLNKKVSIPTLTVENYCKWYNLYLVKPCGSVTPITFGDLDEGSGMHAGTDHVFYPPAVQEYAKRNGYYIDECSFEMIVGRYETERLGNYPIEEYEYIEESTDMKNTRDKLKISSVEPSDMFKHK